MEEERVPDGNSRPRSGVWWVLAGLLIAAFVARAPLYLSVFPPFEGWDEYQHLGYIVHLDETGAIPVFDEARVPLSLRAVVAAMPHSQWGGDQVREWGALSYPDYWKAPPSAAAAAEPASSSPRLYQAQHPPLAYAVALPIWRAFASSPLAAIYAIRAMNVLLVAAALVLFAAALERLVPALAARVAVLALVCLHPLFFQNVARVTNDAAALAAGVAGISLLVLADGRTLLTRGLLAAACIAASIWSKQTGLALIPAFVLGLPLIGWTHGASAGRIWRATSVSVVTLLLLVAPLWQWSYEHYGSIVTTQESLELAARGPVAAAVVSSLRNLAWAPLIDTLFVPGRPWVGGWSFLQVQETLGRVYAWYWSILLAAGALGIVIGILRRARSGAGGMSGSGGDKTTAGLIVCSAVVIFTVLGMIHHAAVSHAVFGRTMTNPWYFMTALPFLFVLLVRALEAIGRRLTLAAAGALAVLFVAIDLHGTWVQMPAAYADTTDAVLQWARLSAVHPAILSGDLRWLFLAIQLAALAFVAGGCVYASRFATLRPDRDRDPTASRTAPVEA